jgi:uncharacterized protein (TIGR02271 family)
MANFTGLTALSDVKNYKVAEDDPDVRGWDVVTTSGERVGSIRDLLIDRSRMKAEYFVMSHEGGHDLLVPAASAQVNAGHRQVLVSGELRDFERYTRSTSDLDSGVEAAGHREHRTDYSDGQRMTRSEEELRIGKREVEAGEVVVAKHVESERVREDVPVDRERVRIERRPVTDARGAADIGEDAIRVPLVEEELIVEKRPVVKEELVISKERVTEREAVDTEVRREEFDVTGDTSLVNGEDAVTRRRRE